MVLFKFLQSHIDVKHQQIPKKKQAQFLKRLSSLLNEGYTFYDSLIMLLPHHVKKSKEAQEKLANQLKNGDGVTLILMTLGIPKSHLLSIQMAESHGRLHQALHVLHTHIAMVERAKASLKKVVMYPVFLFSMLAGLFVAFRTYFLPNMKLLASSRQAATSDSINWASTLLHLPDALLGVCLLLLFITLAFRWKIKRYSLEQQVIILQKTPVLSSWIKLLWTKSFSQEIGMLLASGLSLQHALIALKEQRFQPYLQVIAESIYKSVLVGESLKQAVKVSDCFINDFSTYIAHGEVSGHLARELLIYSDLLNEQTEASLTRWLSFVQPVLFGVLAICILAAYLSILLPVYGMIDFI
ncbi:competence type IV pilus assembly protein ComGB [Paenisporosarcina sp. TG20]|uniref:competence type IV pilus assembly protein ComGB n=1 Tax=Paenisporosarcina sp. TG20 TaxID=1211706 RepID=UPI0002F54C75|nr:competence type IV pilus assembly protein ComGB [Paenisporosarcina sp. TG20]